MTERPFESSLPQKKIDRVLGLRQSRLAEYLQPSLYYEFYILDENGKQGEEPFYLKIIGICDFP